MQVWLTVLASLVAVIIFLYFVLRHYNRNNRRSRYWQNIISILSRGGRLAPYSRSTAIQITSCVWCFTCFFLVQFYCCNWTSQLTTSRQSKALVDSVYEIPNVTGLQITVDRNWAADQLILVRCKCVVFHKTEFKKLPVGFYV
jgi:hypothetical protein